MSKQNDTMRLFWAKPPCQRMQAHLSEPPNSVVGIGPNALCMLHEVAIEEVLQGPQKW